MSLKDLTEREKEIILECLKASINGPFFPESEFHTIFGVYPKEVKEVISNWPNVDEDEIAVRLSINNAMNNLLGYPDNCGKYWSEFITVSKKEIGRIFVKWKGNKVSNYFIGLM